MRIVVVVQARMTSTRLPGKVLVDVEGRPMLAHQIDRLKRSRAATEVMIATTAGATDDPVADLARTMELRCFRGDEHDVLSRYVGAACDANADVVVRCTADCPLIDPGVVDRVIEALLTETEPVDYASNTLERSYPRGLDVEAFHADTLGRLDRIARSAPAREHVTFHLHSERPDLFLKRSVVDVEDNSDLRWTVDTPEDLEFVRRIYREMNLANRFQPYGEVVGYVRNHPELIEINRQVVQKAT